MDAQTVGQIIQWILAPVVMVSGCSLVLSGIIGRFGTINDRLRLMSQERLQLLRASHTDPYADERLDEIDHQIPDLLHRHKQMHDSVLLIYGSIFLFVLDMFAIALLVVSGLPWMSSVVLAFFFGGLLALLLAVGIAMTEMLHSRRAVLYEVERVAKLERTQKP
ncbi:MAG TPA: DUF2721 domain-containing protein [Phototrophicaceae bacterium]|nr:DUF2721 domain-containing protein [Phototrophicaceae bacterium]